LKTKFFKKLVRPFVYLFWRTQISILRACPPLAGLVTSRCIGSDRSPKLWVKTFFRIAVGIPRAISQHWRDKKSKRVVIHRVTICVTTRCTLNCDKCIGHVPDVKDPQDTPLPTLLDDIQALFSCTAFVYNLNLSGGEPFLRSDLDEIIRVCAASGKAGSIDISTNGTVIPSAKVLAALREANVTVKISKYTPVLQPDVEKLKSVLRENGIRYMHEGGEFWFDTRSLGQLQAGSAKRRFSVCAQRMCMLYMFGKLHLCTISVVLTEEGVIPDCREDYINLRVTSPTAFREQWKKLQKKHVISACSYCMGCSFESPKAPVAVQREDPR